MSYNAIKLLDNWTASRVSWVRDFEGVIHVVVRDTTGSDSKYYQSTNNGKSLTYVCDVTGLDHEYFDLMVDIDNFLYIGFQSLSTKDVPGVMKFDAATSTWGAFFEFITGTVNTQGNFGLDTDHKHPQLGVNRMCGVYKRSDGNLYYADSENQHSSGWRINTDASQQYNPKLAIDPVGKIYIGYRGDYVAGAMKARLCQRLETTPPTFSPSVTASVSGHNVTSVEDARIQPSTELPAVLYRRANGGVNELWLSELQPDGTWTQQQVWDGTNNNEFYVGCQLQYDARGSVYVTAVCDPPGGTPGTGEPYIWNQDRALGVTSGWTTLAIWPGGSGGTTHGGAVLSLRGIEFNGLRSSEFYQNIFAFIWAWPSGAGSSQQDLYYINKDEYPGDGCYPTILNPVEGEPPYRVGEELPEERTSIVIGGEGMATLTYPLTPAHYSDPGPEYQVNLAHYELGYVGSRPKYVSGRRIQTAEHPVIDETDRDTALAFLEARVSDLTPFFITDEDGNTISAYFLDNSIDWEEYDVGVFRMSFRIMETL